MCEGVVFLSYNKISLKKLFIMKILGKAGITIFLALSVLITNNAAGEMRYRDPDNACVHAYIMHDDVPVYSDMTEDSEIKTLLSKDTFAQLCKMDPSGWSRISKYDSNGKQLYGWVLSSDLSRIASHFDENRILLTEAEIHIEFEEYKEAFEILKTLANKNYARAQYQLAQMYTWEYEEIPFDQKEAIKWVIKAAENGYIQAINSLIYSYKTDLDKVEGWMLPPFQTGKDLKLHKYWAKKAAETGIAVYQYELAEHYENGEFGFEKNINKALDLYKASAEQDYIEAQERMGEAYYFGDIVLKDYEEAIKWLKMIAELPLTNYWKDNITILKAKYYLGRSYSRLGDYKEAIKWHNEVIEKGTKLYDKASKSTSMFGTGKWEFEAYVTDSTSAIAQIYDFNIKDDNKAFEWYLKAARRYGSLSSKYNLANMYATGRGTLKNYDQAIIWWTMAANDNHPNSQYNLGWSYAKKSSIKDLSRAKYWIKKAYENPNSSEDTIESAKIIWEGYNLWEEEDFQLNDAETSTQPISERTGTGFRVDKSGSILTNNHVIEDCSTIQVEGNIVELVSTDVNNDLALLKGEPSSYIGYFRSGKGIRIGEDITITGYPLRGVLGDGLNAITGTVSSLSGLNNNTTQFQVSAPVNSGNSGGPVLDSSGNIVGVVVSKINQDKAKEVLGEEVSGASFAIKSSIVRDFLDVSNVDYDVARSDNELSNADIVDKAKNFTVLVECWN
jgi:uncharacterized protein